MVNDNDEKNPKQYNRGGGQKIVSRAIHVSQQSVGQVLTSSRNTKCTRAPTRVAKVVGSEAMKIVQQPTCTKSEVRGTSVITDETACHSVLGQLRVQENKYEHVHNPPKL